LFCEKLRKKPFFYSLKAPSLLISGVEIFNSDDNAITVENSIRHTLNFSNAIAFPGLVNHHDHLDFNLFPRLGNRIYNNYTEWGGDIHSSNKDEIARVLKVPLQLRTQWGIYKNLLAGVTTVVNHGGKLDIPDPLITVIQDSEALHSVKFEKYWKIKLALPQRRKVTIHLGEGIDALAHSEIDQFIKWNIFKRKTVAIHGVAMTPDQAAHFDALVWCPESNFFLLNQTAQIDKLKSKIKILFGTDSTLTAPWSIWDHLRTARKTKMLSDLEIFSTVTNNDAPGSWVIAKKKRDIYLEAFYEINPSDILLVIHNHQVRLFDESLLAQLEDAPFPLGNFKKIYLDGCKYVQGNITGLIDDIRKYLPQANFPFTNHETDRPELSL